MARTSGSPGDRGGATMFLIDADTPGMRITRHIDTLDEGFFGGHCELELEDVFVSEEAVLGAVDKGFEYAQVRLAPARLTHCMRWLGIARHAQEIAVNRAAERELFGSRLGDLGMVQAMVADSEIDIAASRLLIWQACAELDQGRSAAQSSSIAKTFVAEAVGRVVDRSVQICGALGISGDMLLSRYLPRGAPVPHLRRLVGDAPLGDREARAAPGRAETGSTPVLTLPFGERRLKWIQFSSIIGEDPAMPVTDHVVLEKDGEIARVWLNRPHKKNAVTVELLHRLDEIIGEVDSDPELRVLILRGREGTFCSGFDLDELLADYVGHDDRDGGGRALGQGVRPALLHEHPVGGRARGLRHRRRVRADDLLRLRGRRRTTPRSATSTSGARSSAGPARSTGCRG